MLLNRFFSFLISLGNYWGKLLSFEIFFFFIYNLHLRVVTEDNVNLFLDKNAVSECGPTVLIPQ